jgi:chaperonin GroEL (HSP60 family)
MAVAVKEAIKLAGIEGNILLEEHDQANIIVELQFGYNFKVYPFKGFIPQFGTWATSNAKVLLVDGMVEKVSELDRVLTKSFETKMPLVLIAQGFSEEVIATLHANNSRGSFNIMPIRLEQSLEALNMLNDIAVVSGCDVVSTLKGELLTYVNYDSLPVVDKVSLTEKVITIHNNSTRGNVIVHLNYLNNRRKDQAENATVSDVADLTTKRIQNLLAHIVKINIPKGSANRFKGPVDNAIRACRTAYTYGFCKPLEIDLEGLATDWKQAHNHMVSNTKDKDVSSIGLYLAAMYGASLAGSYFTASGAVISAT